MLTIHRSAATEPLVDRLAQRLRDAPPDDPFTPVEVAVQSRGMERWLSHQLAQRLGPDGAGICANIDFPFPGKIVTTAAAAALGQRLEDDPWSPDRLVYPLLEVLPDLLSRAELARVADYLGVGGGTGLPSVDRRTWALAREIADLLDRYALHRPEMVRAWSAGEDRGPAGGHLEAAQRWQPALWRALAERIGGDDPTRRLDRAIAELRGGAALADGDLLPQRVTVFGISALPPRHVQLLDALATRLPVDLYVLTPSPRRWERRSDEAPGHEHPLLESCGRLVDDLGIVLADLEHEDRPCDDAPAQAGLDGDAPRLLDALQHDLHEDRDRGAPGDPTPSHPLAPGDTSLQLHACHGPSRQVEVLREVLLGLLADDPTLEPRDVLVMTPDVEAYAPLLGSVFAEVDGGGPTLPVRVADRSLRGTNPVAEVLLSLCALAEGRVTASAVLDLVAAGPVAARFGLSTEDLARVTGWVADSGVRWGIDEDDRADAGQPSERVHTWRFGLDRLLAGVAVADEDDRRVGDVTPFDDVEGQDVDLLGRFADAVTVVFELLDRLVAPRTVAAWAQALGDALDRLVELDDADRWRVHEMRRTLDGLAELPAATSSAPELALGALRSLLEQAVDAGRGAAGYETGAVTVCAMVPMRSIPHRVVCLLGADDDAFPRGGRRRGFDLLAERRRVGDRDRRDEDRFLFLEALLAARDHLVITYTGRDPRTNERRAPAVPVAELLDVLERSAVPAGAADEESGAVRRHLVTEHPLQPFSPRNFGVDDQGRPCPPRSFDSSALVAARRLEGEPSPAPPLIAGRLPDPEEAELAVVRVDELARFLRHPARVLLESRLGLRLREDVTIVSDAEPLDLDALERYGVGASLLEACLQGRDRDRWRDALLARGTVPAGALGRRELGAVESEVDVLLAELPVAPEEVVEEADEQRVDLLVEDARLQGTIGGLHDRTRLVLQYAKVGARHELDLWIHHLALAADGHGDVTSRLIGRAGGDRARVVELPPLAEDAAVAGDLARRQLGRLLRLRRDGLTRVLPLFEKASAAYAKEAMADTDDAHAAGLRAARKAWEPSRLGDGSTIPGDRDEPYVTQAWGDEVELADLDRATDFAALALEVYRPLLEHQVRS